jgi:hypothetical protein
LNPNFIRQPKVDRGIALGLALAMMTLVMAGVLFASSSPDGLQSLAQTLGLTSRATPLIASPLADYQAGFLQSAWLRRSGAGLTGVVLIYGACVLLGRMVGRQRSA